MKQQKLKANRDYKTSPRAAWEAPDPDYRSDIDFEGEVSLTKQSEAEACDINNIMKRYEQTGLLPDSNGRQPTFADFSTMETYQEAMNIVSQANSSFHSLPAEIRARFQNDPAQFLGFVEKGLVDENAAKELIEMGLAVPAPEKPQPEKPQKDAKPQKAQTPPAQPEPKNG